MGKRFLADKFTPSFLIGLCDGLTGFECADVARPFIGEWMRVRGTLFQATPNPAFGTAGVTVTIPGVDWKKGEAFLTFTRDLGELAKVPRDGPIHAEGRIKSISSSVIMLEDCGLVEPRMASILEVSFRADELRRAAEAWRPGEAAELANSAEADEPDEPNEDRAPVDFEHLKLWWAAFSGSYPRHGEDDALASARATFPKHFVRRQWVRDLRGERPMGRPPKNKDK